jgi:hypothetical protein
MIKFTDEMKQRINNAFADKKYCIWATASSDGVPSLSFRGSAFVWDDEHLAVWERSRQSGAEHWKRTPTSRCYTPISRHGPAGVFTLPQVRSLDVATEGV